MSEELPRAGVSAEDLVAVIRVHLDRVHDAVRRLGCDPAAAVEVVETSALDLVDVVADRPESVDDAVGWWFARARALGRTVVGSEYDLPLGRGVLADDEDQQVLAEALEQLPETERMALLLRDSYDLADVSVAAALGLSPDTAMERVGRARLQFLPLVDDEPAPRLVHRDSLGALARLGEGGAVASRDATVRRHALSCESCRTVTDAQQRAHLLLAGLSVAALPESEREGVLERAETYAYEALPTSAALVLRGRQLLERDPDDEPRLFSPLLAMMAMVLAVLLGLGAGLLISRTGGPGVIDNTALQNGGQLIAPPPPPAATLPSPPALEVPPAQTRVFEVPPSPRPPSPSPSPTLVIEDLQISIDPDSGPNGQSVTVTGRGWDPGIEVTVEYLDTLGDPTGSRAFAFVNNNGRFTTTLIAFDPASIPGPHVVQASSGSQTAEASFNADG